jgi:hypothetical protein
MIKVTAARRLLRLAKAEAKIRAAHRARFARRLAELRERQRRMVRAIRCGARVRLREALENARAKAA